MPPLDFPASPTIGQKYPVPAVTGVPTYVWDGTKWLANFPLGAEALLVTGGTMTGDITLTVPPDQPMEVANKGYVDTAITTAGAGYQAKDPQLFAGVPLNNQTANYTLIATDAQKAVVGKTNGLVVTIPPNSSVPFPIGTAVTVICWVGGTISVAAGAGVAAYVMMGTTITSLPRTLANGAIVTFIKMDTDVWFGSGSGVT